MPGSQNSSWGLGWILLQAVYQTNTRLRKPDLTGIRIPL